MGAEFQIMGLDRFAFRQWLALQLTPMAGQAATTPPCRQRRLLHGAAGARLVTAGVLRLGRRGVDLTERLLSLSVQFAGLIRELAPGEVAIEEAFFGKSVQSALRIGEARGVVLAEAARSGLDVFQYTPARVKRCVAGHGAARKQSVASMLAQNLPEMATALPGDLPEDATDALAVAWTRLEELRSPLLRRASKPARGLTRGDD